MMPADAEQRGMGPKLIALARDAVPAAEAVLRDATAAVRARIGAANPVTERLLDREQRATHGLAWLATYGQAIRPILADARRLHGDGGLREVEKHVVWLGLDEYLAQILGGIPMSQGEVVRPADLGLSAQTVAGRLAGPLTGVASGNRDRRARLITLMGADH